SDLVARLAVALGDRVGFAVEPPDVAVAHLAVTGAALGQVIDLAALIALDPPRAAGAPRSRGRQAALQPGTAVAVVECPLPLAGAEGVGVAHQTAAAPVTRPRPGRGWK